MLSYSFVIRDVVVAFLFRCFSDVKTAVWISTANGMTTGLDLEILAENSGLVNATFFTFVYYDLMLISCDQPKTNRTKSGVDLGKSVLNFTSTTGILSMKVL